MKRIFVIAHSDLRVFLRNRTNYVWLFVVPLVFIGFMGFAFKPPPDPANARPAVIVDNQDTNYLGARFLEEIGTQGLRVLPPSAASEARQRIRIPVDFTARILAGKTAEVQLLQNKNAVAGEAAMVELRLVRAVIAMNSHLVLTAGATGGGFPDAGIRTAQRADSFVRLDARFAGRKPTPAGFGFSLPGNMVMYIMLNLLIFGGAGVARQREKGIVRRLACTPLTRGQAVAGKIIGLILLGGLQTAVFLLAGRFLFGVNIGANLAPLLVTLLVYSWVAASLGLLVGSMIRAEDKVIGVCILASLLMAALGGCWWPMEVGPPALKVVAHCVPTGWAVDALHQLISFGGGFPEAAKSIGVLSAFGLGANTLAALCFRW